MDNVVNFPNKVLEPLELADPVTEFITEALIPWAFENGVDIDSMLFKLNAAGVMTLLQGMLLNV
jgi:hypothetical protein